MTNEVFSWTAASNNQGLVAGQLSYILNSISAYRTAQTSNPSVADDIFFTPALNGPGGKGLASQHVVRSYMIPRWAKNVDKAKQFLLDLVGAAHDAVYNSELYDFPAFSSTPRPRHCPAGSAAIPSSPSPRTSWHCWQTPRSGPRMSGIRARRTRRSGKSSTPMSSRP